MTIEKGSITVRLDVTRESTKEDDVYTTTRLDVTGATIISSTLSRDALDAFADDEDLVLRAAPVQDAVLDYLEDQGKAAALPSDLDEALDQDFTLPPNVLAQIKNVKMLAETVKQSGMDKPQRTDDA